MDPTTLSQLLKRTLDPSLRQDAEAELNKIHKIIGFSPGLLRVVMCNDIEMPTRQAGAVYFKNMVAESWVAKKDNVGEVDEDSTFSIHEQDRGLIRDNLIQAIVQAPDVIKKQLAACVSSIVKHDFPSRWPQVVDQISICLQSPDGVSWPGALLALYQLVKKYEYKKKEDRLPLYDAMNLLLPLLYDVMTRHINEHGSQECAEIQKMILKIYFALTQYILPLEIVDRDRFTKWMEVLRTVVEQDVPSHTAEVEEEERPQLIWWKRKKWAHHTLTRFFERFGSPGNVSNEYKQFADWYIKTFSHGIMTSILKVLDQYRSNVYVSPRVMQLSLNYVNTAVSHSLSWKIIKPYMLQVIQSVVFPLMSYSERDAELWDTDPYQYIRIKFDIFEEFISPITAAQTLLHSVCKKRKDMLPKTMAMLLQVVQAPETTPSQKDGALHMIGTMADILLKKKNYKDQMEQFLVNIVFPEFGSRFGHLRARACWMLRYFADVKYNNPNVLGEAIRFTIVSLLEDKEVPVKVEAAIALQMILSSHEVQARPYIEPKVKEITLHLLEIIRETENDDLTTVMQKIISSYVELLTPVAVDICRHLVDTFAQVLDVNETGDEKAITAMGLLNTMEIILKVMEGKKIHETLEPILLQAVHHIFKNSIMEFYEEAFSLTYDLTCTTVSVNMWNMLEVIYEVFNKDGFDYFTDMMPTLHNYVTVDTDAFLSNPAFITAIYNMCKKMFESDSGEDPECHAAKMLEVMILQCKGRGIDKFIPTFVETVFLRLAREIKTSELRTMCLQVAIAAMYYDSNIFFETLQSLTVASGGSRHFIEQFIEQWIHDTDCFIGLHDRKICVIGLCQLMTMPTIPGVEAQSAKLIPSVLLLFDGLKRAYEAQANEIESSSSDDDDDLEDEDILDSEEDEIDEEGAEYLEDLEAKIKANNGGFDIRTNVEEWEDSDDDYDYYEETPLESYTTPLDGDDGVDEYLLFKDVLSSLEKQNPNWHRKLFEGLSKSHMESLNEVFTLGSQRLASKESENIKKAGGYSFDQQTVPGQFNFGAPSSFAFGK